MISRVLLLLFLSSRLLSCTVGPHPSEYCSAILRPTLRSVKCAPLVDSLKTAREQVAELWKRKAFVIKGTNHANGKARSRNVNYGISRPCVYVCAGTTTILLYRISEL